MRAVNIQIITGSGGFRQMKASFQKNWPHYLQEALGLALFMASACFFGTLLGARTSSWHTVIASEQTRNLVMGLLMGVTALFIFYSPFTAGSGSHINPAVTLAFLRLGKMCRYDAMFYMIFQFLGGISAVYLMGRIMGKELADPPVNYVVTIPGRSGMGIAALTEFCIAFVMLTLVLFSSASNIFRKYTRLMAACLVAVYVVIAGPVSGFGMNPARTLASAIPAHIYKALWIYMIIPFAGMLLAAELFWQVQKRGRI